MHLNYSREDHVAGLQVAVDNARLRAHTPDAIEEHVDRGAQVQWTVS